ncbi:hypothetical protein [Sphingomonas sp. Leaf17]|nr:hypothetical protein [Sphingomonas sp. Leaf17]
MRDARGDVLAFAPTNALRFTCHWKSLEKAGAIARCATGLPAE